MLDENSVENILSDQLEETEENIDIVENEIDKNIEEPDQEVLQAEEKTEEEAPKTPVEKIIKYIKSPIREDNSEIIESMIELSSSLESIGIESIELTKLLNDQERARLDLLKEMSKRGLSEDQYPMGKSTKEDIDPIAFCYSSKNSINGTILAFMSILEELAKNDSIEHIDTAQHQLKILEEFGFEPIKYILNRDQKKGYYKLLSIDERLSKGELNYLLQFMKGAVFTHSKTLKEREEYYKKMLRNLESIDFPNVKDLIDSVRVLKNKLSFSLEEIPSLNLTKEERANLANFLPAFDEYYKDQVCAFSGGKSFLPLASNLKRLQESIENRKDAKSLIEGSKTLGFTMQRLYVLHWVAENLMKDKYNTTLGKSLALHKTKNRDLEALQAAVRFRNDIAHNGVIWKPEDFEKNIKTYEAGIEAISKEFAIDLDKYTLSKQNRTKFTEEAEKDLSDEVGLKIENVYLVDKRLKNRFEHKRLKKLKDIIAIVKNESVFVDDFVEKNISFIREVYDLKETINEKRVAEKVKRFYQNIFAENIFGMNYSELMEKAPKVQENSIGWIYAMSIKYGNGTITRQEKADLNNFKVKIYAK